MANFLFVNADSLKRRMQRIAAEGKTLAKPLNSTRGKEALRILRFGTKGVRAQFNDQTEYKGKSSNPWKRGHDFGIRKAPKKTMQGTGAYRSAFLGGKGRIEEITANSVRVGVSKAVFPQVVIHQGSYATRRIKPKQKIASGPNKGQWKMRFFLGMTYGVWMKNSRVGKGFSIARRRVSVSDAVKREIRAYLKRDIAIKAGLRRSA